MSGIRVANYGLELMRRIRQVLADYSLLAVPLAVALLAAGCSRSIAVPDDGAAAQPDPQTTPFHEDGTKPDYAGAEANAAGGKAAASANLPFHDRENLPAGTLISVRLKAPISVQDSRANDPFEALVVEPVVIQGHTLIPPGTPVSGRVESARTSKLKRNRGYVRLALASVHLGGVDVPVQTASLFARQSPVSDDSPPLLRLEQGRRLTFSLSEPLYLATQRAQANH